MKLAVYVADPIDTQLASGISVADYKRWVEQLDRVQISDMVFKRFLERYLLPVTTGDNRHGFTIMAVSCLMIEALETFRRGEKHSERKSKEFITGFLSRSPRFQVFTGHESDFYYGVRCGILHQAETARGWKIRRDGPLLDVGTKTINAIHFARALEGELREYCDRLLAEDWESQTWANFRRRMDQACKNCRTEHA